jgi:hypothetical protein
MEWLNSLTQATHQAISQVAIFPSDVIGLALSMTLPPENWSSGKVAAHPLGPPPKTGPKIS